MAVFDLIACIFQHLFTIRRQDQVIPAIRCFYPHCFFSEPVINLRAACLIQGILLHFLPAPAGIPFCLPYRFHDLARLKGKLSRQPFQPFVILFKRLRHGFRILSKCLQPDTDPILHSGLCKLQLRYRHRKILKTGRPFLICGQDHHGKCFQKPSDCIQSLKRSCIQK